MDNSQCDFFCNLDALDTMENVLAQEMDSILYHLTTLDTSVQLAAGEKILSGEHFDLFLQEYEAVKQNIERVVLWFLTFRTCMVTSYTMVESAITVRDNLETTLD